MITLSGHQYPVTAIAYSPDGGTLATGDARSCVKLWQPFTGSELFQCASRRHTFPVRSLSFSPDGKWLVAGLAGEAIVWSVSSGRLLHRHRLSAETVANPEPTFAAFHPGGEHLILAYGKDTIVEVEPLSDRRIRTYMPQHQHFYPYGARHWGSLCLGDRHLAVGSIDHVFLWGGLDGEPHVRSLHWPNGEFNAVSADASGRWLAGGRGKGVALWDLHNLGDPPRRTRTLKVGDQVNAVALTPDGRTLLAAGDDWTVHVWDVPSGQKRNEFNWRLGPLVALAVSPDGMTCAVSGRKSSDVFIWDLE